jgi:hypothetical protein
MRVIVAAFIPSAGRLDHAVQRDVLDDPDVSHLSLIVQRNVDRIKA